MQGFNSLGSEAYKPHCRRTIGSLQASSKISHSLEEHCLSSFLVLKFDSTEAMEHAVFSSGLVIGTGDDILSVYEMLSESFDSSWIGGRGGSGAKHLRLGHELESSPSYHTMYCMSSDQSEVMTYHR